MYTNIAGDSKTAFYIASFCQKKFHVIALLNLPIMEKTLCRCQATSQAGLDCCSSSRAPCKQCFGNVRRGDKRGGLQLHRGGAALYLLPPHSCKALLTLGLQSEGGEIPNLAEGRHLLLLCIYLPCPYTDKSVTRRHADTQTQTHTDTDRHTHTRSRARSRSQRSSRPLGVFARALCARRLRAWRACTRVRACVSE